MIDQQSSISEDCDFGRFSKPINNVDYQDSNSAENQSEPQRVASEKKKRKSYSKRISSILDNEEEREQMGKTKNIKKNCVSAKKSRLRKKIYIELLEKKADTLREQILKKKERITANRNGIVSLLRQNNPQKCRYIEEKIAESKILANELKSIQDEENSKAKEEGKSHKGREADYRPNLKYIVDSFIYKFGFSGVLRQDVLEQLKMKWYELAIDEKILLNGYENELKTILERFRNCMKELEAKNKGMEFLMRNLQEKLSQKDVITILLKPEFRNEEKENPQAPPKASILDQEEEEYQ